MPCLAARLQIGRIREYLRSPAYEQVFVGTLIRKCVTHSCTHSLPWNPVNAVTNVPKKFGHINGEVVLPG